jgi:hypothetical protein
MLDPVRGNKLSILLFSLRLISLPRLHNEELEATSARVLSMGVMGVSFRPDHETDSQDHKVITGALWESNSRHRRIHFTVVTLVSETNLQVSSMCNL